LEQLFGDWSVHRGGTIGAGRKMPTKSEPSLDSLVLQIELNTYTHL
jgi:hypothetical protein